MNVAPYAGVLFVGQRERKTASGARGHGKKYGSRDWLHMEQLIGVNFDWNGSFDEGDAFSITNRLCALVREQGTSPAKRLRMLKDTGAIGGCTKEGRSLWRWLAPKLHGETDLIGESLRYTTYKTLICHSFNSRLNAFHSPIPSLIRT